MIVKEILPLIKKESVILLDAWNDYEVIDVQNQNNDIDEIYHDLEIQEIGITLDEDIYLEVTTEFFGQIYSLEKKIIPKEIDEYELSELAIEKGSFEEEYYSDERGKRRREELRKEHPELEFICIG